MTQRIHSRLFSSNCKLRWQKRLQQLAQMREAKERKRQKAIADGWTPEPKPGQIERHPFLSWAIRDDLSGDIVWRPFVSVRDVAKRAGVVARYYQPRP